MKKQLLLCALLINCIAPINACYSDSYGHKKQHHVRPSKKAFHGIAAGFTAAATQAALWKVYFNFVSAIKNGTLTYESSAKYSVALPFLYGAAAGFLVKSFDISNELKWENKPLGKTVKATTFAAWFSTCAISAHLMLKHLK